MKTINIKPYNIDLHIFTSPRSLKMYCKKNSYLMSMEDNDIVDLDIFRGLSLLYPDNTMLLYLPKEYDEDTLDHELIHITWFIARIIGQPLTWDNNEFQAYLFPDLKRLIKKKVYKL